MAKGIVKRGVTELVTPGVATNDKLLEHSSNNFLAAIHLGTEKTGLAFFDISTGEFFVAEGDADYADKLLQNLQPVEIVYQRNRQKNFKEQFSGNYFTYALDEWIFSETYATENLLKHFGTHSLKGFGIEEMKDAIIASGAILHYLKDTEHPNLQHLSTIQHINKEDHLWMDRFTIRNLELISHNPEQQTLYKIINNTVSPMGARLLKRWMMMPLNDIQKINERLYTVELLIKETETRNQLLQHIRPAGRTPQNPLRGET